DHAKEAACEVGICPKGRILAPRARFPSIRNRPATRFSRKGVRRRYQGERQKLERGTLPRGPAPHPAPDPIGPGGAGAASTPSERAGGRPGCYGPCGIVPVGGSGLARYIHYSFSVGRLGPYP